MSQPDQIPAPEVPTGPRTGPQKDGGKGPHIAIAVQGLQSTDSMVPPILQAPTGPSSGEPGAGGTNLDGGKGPH
jgi:hypothetical protein